MSALASLVYEVEKEFTADTRSMAPFRTCPVKVADDVGPLMLVRNSRPLIG